MAVSNKLSSLSKMWKQTASVQPSFSNVPEGDYVGDLKEMKLEEAKKSGRLQVVTTIEIVDGDYTGKTVKRFDGLDKEQSIGYFKGLCEIIGLDIPDDLNNLQEAMDDFIANNADLFNITIKNNDKYSNVYINGVSEYTKGGEEGEEEAGEEVSEEEVSEEEVSEEEEIVEEGDIEEEVGEEVEEEEQEVRQPVRKAVAKASVKVAAKVPVKVAAKAPVKVSAQPAKKVVLKGR